MRTEEAIRMCENITSITGIYCNIYDVVSNKYIRIPYLYRCPLRDTACRLQKSSEQDIESCPSGFYFVSAPIQGGMPGSRLRLVTGPFLITDYGTINADGINLLEMEAYSVPNLTLVQTKALLETIKCIAGTIVHFGESLEYSISEPFFDEYIPNNPHAVMIHRLKVYVYSNLSNELTLSETAAYFHLSESYMCRVLKKELGFSFKEYVNILRVEQSKLYLNQHKYKISEVAAMCGFPDHNYYSRVFRKLEGMTPSAYMRQGGARGIAKAD